MSDTSLADGTFDSETTRSLLVRVLGEALDAAGGFVPDSDNVFELIKRFHITRDEVRTELGYEKGEKDYLPYTWPEPLEDDA